MTSLNDNGKQMRKCFCSLCERNRKFEAIIGQLKKQDRKWMDALYNYFFEIEAELELIRASKENRRKVAKK